MAVKKLRTPDGRPQHRSIDETIKDAIDREDLSQLPGWGKPLDLKDYFASAPEQRAANQLLKNNKVLPQPLQDRKEAEDLQAEAATYLAREEQTLQSLASQIAPIAQRVTAPLPNLATLLELTDLPTRPSYLPEPLGAPLPSRRQFLDAARELVDMVVRYNRRIELTISHYLDLLERSNDSIDRLNTQIFFSRHLPPNLQLHSHNLDDKTADLRNRLTSLPTLPQDLPDRLERYYKTARPSTWHRLTRALLSA